METIDRYRILAAAASFWQPGLGQILTKRILRGIIILTLFLRLAITIWATYDAYNLASQTPAIHSTDSTPNP